ncbi:MAG TPA: hypothetical protein VJU54_07800, partial [Nitrospiraceae bacterium]|nr:hypothetical protein [Nitrospiraceae bacterium]
MYKHIKYLYLVFSLHYALSSCTHRLKTMIRVSGRLQSEHLDELKTQIAGIQSRIALDLNGVTLVDVEIVRFLNVCER